MPSTSNRLGIQWRIGLATLVPKRCLGGGCLRLLCTSPEAGERRLECSVALLARQQLPKEGMLSQCLACRCDGFHIVC
jgi:hypothetical protein